MNGTVRQGLRAQEGFFCSDRGMNACTGGPFKTIRAEVFFFYLIINLRERVIYFRFIFFFMRARHVTIGPLGEGQEKAGSARQE